MNSLFFHTLIINPFILKSFKVMVFVEDNVPRQANIEYIGEREVKRGQKKLVIFVPHVKKE